MYFMPFELIKRRYFAENSSYTKKMIILLVEFFQWYLTENETINLMRKEVSAFVYPEHLVTLNFLEMSLN